MPTLEPQVPGRSSSNIDALVTPAGDPSGDSYKHPASSTPVVAIEVAGGEVAPPPEGVLPADANTGASGFQEVELAEEPSKKCQCKSKKHPTKDQANPVGVVSRGLKAEPLRMLPRRGKTPNT
ncbi:hypothetical protein Salat_2595800 [Sesamum alatum]|uniref:Uncharacterized protein n=1 Tax=Sesamum alatum TaxID=300844 RepID=A0AAE2CAD1_9LAMI|nr:hypothetical protein Salat_2595800 [Sesamum alatum]